MESKLKALKVADLKNILSQVSVTLPSRATKADLIAKVLDTPAALALISPPPDTDTLNSTPPNPSAATPVPQPAPASPPPTAPDPTPPSQPAPSSQDDETAKRKARAERFGVPLLSPKPNTTDPRNAPLADPEKLKARAQRFGITHSPTLTAPTAQKKRQSPAAAESVDPEEAERRRKRAARFGTTD